jgi:lipopolysaccharide/colanic/teichoic acid biosynthesis glycosyltransferase
MSSSVIRLAYVAIRRRAAARRSGGITLPDLDPGPEAADAIAQALHDVAPAPPAIIAATTQATAAPETHSTRQAPPQGAALIDVDTVTGAATIPSTVTLTQRVAVARNIDTGAAVPLQLELFDGAAAARRGEIAIRALNVAIAAVLLVLLSPVLLLITAAVKLTSRGPVFYQQVRVGLDRRRYRSLTPLDRRQRGERRTIRPAADGRRVRVSTVPVERRGGGDRRTGLPDRRVQQIPVEKERRSGVDRRYEHRAAAGDRRKRIANARHDRRQWNLCGRMFTMYKFRTMRLDAESGTGAVWARQDDPRVTPIGGFLRACRLDELPQLYNVLKGDMNIVGPRPERPTMVVDLVNAITEYPIRQRTLPGITGLAQISQAPDGTVDDVRVKVRYDLEYMRRRSVLEDLRIMAKTPMVMFFKRSGY